MSVLASHFGELYRGRLAPSPTGLLHLGHARTFWTASERARLAGGTLVLRDEDLDPHRSRPAYAQAMLEDLRWLGIKWAEGPDVSGPCAPYRQSERQGLYLAAWRSLVESGWVYPCRCSRRELRRELLESVQAPHDGPANSRDATDAIGAADVIDVIDVEQDQDEDDEPLYRWTCRPPARVPAEPSPLQPAPLKPTGVNWRFRVPDGEAIVFEDGQFGQRRYVAGRDFSDFLVWRREDVPAYQLAVVVDDAAMKITEVVRGADLLKSTARQLLLYGALGLTPPRWFHCPLVTDQAGRRLAKRSDALSIRALRAAGHTPAQVLALANG